MKKTLTKLMLLLGVFVLLGASNASAWTVYYSNPDRWSNVSVWAWGDNNTNFTDNQWPGKAMTYNPSTDLWSYTGTGNPTSLLFNDGKANTDVKTGDLIFRDNATYGKDGVASKPADIGWHLVGNNYGWEAKDQFKFKRTDTNVYTLETTDFSGDFKIVFFDGNGLFYDSSFGKIDNDSYPQFAIGREYQSTKDGKNIPFSGKVDKVSITINQSTYRITVKEVIDLYLVGNDVNGDKTWGTTNIKLTDKGDGKYEWTGTKLGAEFKITDDPDSWNGKYDIGQYPGASLTVGVEYGYKNQKNDETNENFKFTDRVDYVINPKIELDINNKNIKVSGTPHIKGDDLYLFKSDGETWNYKDGNIFNEDNGTYTIETEFKSTLGYSYWTIAGNATGSNWADINVKCFPEAGNIYSGKKPDGAAEVLSADFMVNIYDVNTPATISTNDTNGNGAFIVPDGKYSISFNSNDNVVTVTLKERYYPKAIYVYGHIKNKYWDKTNAGKLEAVTDKPGHFKIEKVLVQGRWNQHDVDVDDTHSRHKNHSTIDENYLGFFLSNKADISTSGELTQLKLGSTKYDNEEVYKPEGSVEVDKETGLQIPDSDNRRYPDEDYVERKCQFVRHGDSYNFKVGEGIYDIEVNLNEGEDEGMWVRFYRIKPDKSEKLEAEYVWFFGEDPETAESLDSEETQRVSVNDNHKFQVGIENDTEHPLALQVQYTVYKKPAQGIAGKRYDISTEGMTEAKGVSAEEYTTDSDADYVWHGDDTIDSNHLIEFKKAGNYIIEASVNQNAVEVEDYNLESMPKATLAVEVAAAGTETGVEVVEAAEDGDAVYYNLQGVRVQNPEKGIFVKVAGGKAVKVVINE